MRPFMGTSLINIEIRTRRIEHGLLKKKFDVTYIRTPMKNREKSSNLNG